MDYQFSYSCSIRNLGRLLLAAIFTIAVQMTVAASGSAGQDSVKGNWLGTLKVPGQELRAGIAIGQKPDGALSGTFSSIDQGATLPVDEVVFTNRQLRFSLNNIHASYEGTLQADGKSFAGKWRQGGGEIPLNLSKVDQFPTFKRPQNPVKPYPYQEQTVRYENKKAGITLAGTLTMPKGPGPFPAMILLTGSGPQNRDEELFQHKPFLVLADYLTRHGFAVLRADDRGVGGSTGDFDNSTTGDFADDALAGVAYLKTRKEIAPNRIGLVGHSEGGMMAPLAAIQSKDVAFIVMLAGTGVPFSQVVVDQIGQAMRQHGAPDDVISASAAWRLKLYAIAGERIDNQAAEQKLRSLYATLDEAQRQKLDWPQARMDGEIPGLLRPWWRFAMGYSPRDTLMKVTCPVLALNGSKDTQVRASENLPAIEKALADGHNKHYTVKQLSGLNHLFQTAETGNESEYVRIEETMSPEAMRTIADWVSQLPKTTN